MEWWNPQVKNIKRLRLVVIIAAILVTATQSLAQTSTYKGFPSLIWPKLYDIQYVKASDKLGEYQKPIFTAAVKALNGKSIVLPGYMVPFENGMKGTHFMFTSLPLNACFFCGVGGPETVIEVFTRSVTTYTEKPVEVRGVLKLNDTNPDQMMYILEGAELLGEIGF